jgi:hypothetical protein
MTARPPFPRAGGGIADVPMPIAKFGLWGQSRFSGLLGIASTVTRKPPFGCLYPRLQASHFGVCRPKSLRHENRAKEVSHPVLRSARLPERSKNRPEIRAFRAFDLVFGLRVCRSRGGNRRKSPALSANIPVLRRLSAETGSITTAARGRQSISRTDKVSNKGLQVSCAKMAY